MLNPGDFYLTHDQMVARIFSVLNPENPISYQLQVDGQPGLITIKADEANSLTTLRTMNPKDQAAQSKPGLTNVPLAPLYEVSAALVEGAIKYGPWNWRSVKVDASVYVAAAMRHLSQYQAGEDIDPDSGISHITKAIAGLVILRDAMIHDCVNDDRGPAQDLNLAGLQTAIQDLKAKYAGPDKLHEDQLDNAALPSPVAVARSEGPIELEVGKTYINRWGETSTITHKSTTNMDYPFSDGQFTFNKNGRFFEGCTHRCDLVEEVKPELQLEDGKTYLTRDREEITVKKLRDGTYPFAGPDHSYTNRGEVFQNYESPGDLVREVVTEKEDSGFRLQAGKTYLSREGKEVTVSNLSNTGYPFAGPDETYTAKGEVFEGVETTADLVSEVVTPLQLEAGKTYINRNGCFIRVKPHVSDLYPFTDGTFSYTAEGVFDLLQEDHRLDLITELPEDTEVESSTPLQLEAGKTYVSRCGVRVAVVAHDSRDYPFSGPSHTYTPDGHVYEEADCGWDLVREA